MNNYFKAVILSNIFDLVASLIFGVVFICVIVIGYHLDLGPNNGDLNIFNNFLDLHPAIHFSLFLVPRAIISIIAGFLAAKIAKDKFLLMGGTSSVLTLLGGLIMLLSPNASLKEMYLLILSPLLGITGGYLFSKHGKTEDVAT